MFKGLAMWVKIGNMVAIPKIYFEGDYTLSFKTEPMLKGNWYIYKSLPPYETVFECVNYWADISEIKNWMPDTYKALMDCPPTLEQYIREKAELCPTMTSFS